MNYPKPKKLSDGIWWDRQWSPWVGCTPVSRGCDRCWAARVTDGTGPTGLKRLGECPTGFNGGPVFKGFMYPFGPSPRQKPAVVGVCMRSDLGHDAIAAEYRWRAFNIMLACHQHLFVIPTKRPQSFVGINAPPNAWLLISVEDQATADERLKYIGQLHFPVVGVSLEPMLGPVDLSRWLFYNDSVDGSPVVNPRLDWVVLGGESGPGARPMHPDWARSVRDQCAAAGVAYLHKQNGEWIYASQTTYASDECRSKVDASIFRNKGTRIEGPEWAYRVGKKLAGRLLDGVQHDGWPEVSNG